MELDEKLLKRLTSLSVLTGSSSTSQDDGTTRVLLQELLDSLLNLEPSDDYMDLERGWYGVWGVGLWR